MVDIWTKARRSQMMSLIRSRGNKSTELRFIALLRGSKITGWRRHVDLPGRPDFVFSAARVAVFVDGDFGHGNPATYKPPTSNVDFWKKKIAYNRKKDRRTAIVLRKQGWKVLRIWESDLKKESTWVIRRLRKYLIIAARN
jgi:DNA mismatch endonuclease, patch repair protein